MVSVSVVAEWFAFNELGNDIRRVVFHPHVVDRNDIGVIQRCYGMRLEFKPLAPSRVCGKFPGQDFHRNLALQPRVPCAIDLAHSAGAEG